MVDNKTEPYDDTIILLSPPKLLTWYEEKTGNLLWPAQPSMILALALRHNIVVFSGNITEYTPQNFVHKHSAVLMCAFSCQRVSGNLYPGKFQAQYLRLAVVRTIVTPAVKASLLPVEFYRTYPVNNKAFFV